MKDFPERQSIRLPFYDYGSAGGYFVTIDTRGKRPLFGAIRDEQLELNQWGRIAQENWLAVPKHFPHVVLDAFIIMPTHMHGILFIVQQEPSDESSYVRAQHAAPIQHHRPRVLPGSLGAIIRSYKSAVTKAINEQRYTPPGQSAWHHNCYERVIRNQAELDEIRHYITNNAPKHHGK